MSKIVGDGAIDLLEDGEHFRVEEWFIKWEEPESLCCLDTKVSEDSEQFLDDGLLILSDLKLICEIVAA